METIKPLLKKPSPNVVSESQYLDLVFAVSNALDQQSLARVKGLVCDNSLAYQLSGKNFDRNISPELLDLQIDVAQAYLAYRLGMAEYPNQSPSTQDDVVSAADILVRASEDPELASFLLSKALRAVDDRVAIVLTPVAAKV